MELLPKPTSFTKWRPLATILKLCGFTKLWLNPVWSSIPNLGVEYVARLFAQTRIRRAPVIQGKTLLGIISVSDILFKSDFVEKPKRLFIEDEIEAAREDARAICAAKGEISPDCAAAWDVVEELQAEASHQRVKKQGNNSLQSYCEANPDALECRIYED